MSDTDVPSPASPSVLQKSSRIYVYFEMNPRQGLITCLEGTGSLQKRPQRFSPQNQMMAPVPETCASGHSEGPISSHSPGSSFSIISPRFGRGLGFSLILAPEYEPDKPREGRKPELFALLELPIVKAFHIDFRRMDDGRMPGIPCLNEDSSVRKKSAGPSCDLYDQRERPLGRPEIGHMQARIGERDSHEANSGEIEAFRDHLRTQQNVDFSRSEFVKHAFQRSLLAERVGIETLYGEIRKGSSHLVFDEFGSESRVSDVERSAFRARPRRRELKAAIMAFHDSLSLVPGEGNRTVFAFHFIAAGIAAEKMRKTSAVKEEYRLASRFFRRLNFCYEFIREGSVGSSQIDDFDFRRSSAG